MTDDRVPRLLNLVPYLQARPGILAAEAAAELGISEAQLRKDLDLLWVCGLPGHGPGDLIDLSFEGDTVTVTFDAGMQRPLRLTADEALSLIVALRTLTNVPGLAERDVVERALAKIEAAAGGQGAGADSVEVALEDPQRADILATVRRALEGQRALHLTYFVAARDELTERDVDPMRLLLVDGRTYLEAWCRLAEDVRLFRLDRIDGVRLLAERSQPPERAVPRDITEGLFRPAPEHRSVTVLLGPGARWVADYYPCESVLETDGGLQVVLKVADPRWIRRLVLGLGAAATIVAPTGLAEEVRAEAAAALAAYEPLGSTL